MGDMRKTIGIIGFGNMGSAIAERAKTLFNIIVFDKIKAINTKGLRVANNLSDLIDKSEAIILAVKPQDIPGPVSYTHLTLPTILRV